MTEKFVHTPSTVAEKLGISATYLRMLRSGFTYRHKSGTAYRYDSGLVENVHYCRKGKSNLYSTEGVNQLKKILAKKKKGKPRMKDLKP